MPISGFGALRPGLQGPFTCACRAPARRIGEHLSHELIEADDVAHQNIIVMSEIPTYDDVSPDATWRPSLRDAIGQARASRRAAEVPCRTPRPIIACTSPRVMRCSSSPGRACHITGCDARATSPLEGGERRAAARATCARCQVGLVGAGITPM